MVAVGQDIDCRVSVVHHPGYGDQPAYTPGMEIQLVAPVVLLEPSQPIAEPVGIGQACGGIEIGLCQQGMRFKKVIKGFRFKDGPALIHAPTDKHLQVVLHIFGAGPDHPCRPDLVGEVGGHFHEPFPFLVKIGSDIIPCRKDVRGPGYGALHFQRVEYVFLNKAGPVCSRGGTDDLSRHGVHQVVVLIATAQRVGLFGMSKSR